MLGRRMLLLGAIAVGAAATGCLPNLAGEKPPTKLRVAVPQLTDVPIDPSVDRLRLIAGRLPKSETGWDLEVVPVRATSAGYPDAVAALGASADTAPDLVVVPHGDVPALVAQKAVLSLDNLARDDRGLALDDYFPGVVEANRYRGQLYGLPYVCSPTVVYYNPTSFARSGMKVPSPDWDWQRFAQLAKALNRDTDGDGKVDQWGLLQMPGFPPSVLYIWQNGGELVDSSGRVAIERPEAVEALTFMQDLARPGGAGSALPDTAGSAMTDLLVQGKVAMVFYHVSLGIFWRGEGFGFDLAEPPRGRAQASLLTSSALAVGAKTSTPEHSYQALRRIVDELQRISLVPPRRSLAGDLRRVEPLLSDQDVRVITATLGYSRGPVYENHSAVMAALEESVDQPLLAGQKTPTQAARDGARANQAALEGRT